jgi:hypothetical protein
MPILCVGNQCPPLKNKDVLEVLPEAIIKYPEPEILFTTLKDSAFGTV